MRIHLVVNVSQVIRYRKLVKRQRVEKSKLVKVNREEKWKVKKILNKQKIREVIKYLVYWRKYIAKHNIWKREENLKNIKKVVANFEGRISVEVRI